MLYELSIKCLFRFYDNSDTNARGEALGQRISGEAETKVQLQGVAYDGRGISPITDTG